MVQPVVVLFLIGNAALSVLGQEDLGGPPTAENAGHVLLQTLKEEIKSTSHAEDSADVSVESEESTVLEGMDKPEEPEVVGQESDVHDLNDYQVAWAHEPAPDDGLSEQDRLALTEIMASDPGPLPNFTDTTSLIDSEDGDGKFGDSTDDLITAPEDQGESSNVVNDPGDESFTADSQQLKKEDHVEQADFGPGPNDGGDGHYGYADLRNANESVSGLEVHDGISYGIKPESGDKIPSFAQSFAGCGCNYQEWSNQWTCSGTIAVPKSVSGKECCCCTMSCDRRNRCDHETCDAIGIDQRAEVEAYERERKKKLGDADHLICDTKLYRVPVGPGRCSNSKNLAACRKIGKWPLCDHSSYAGRGKQCYFPRNKKPCQGHHIGHVGHERSMHFNTMDFFGMCFVTNNGDHTLIPHAEGHTWNNHGGNYNMNDPGTRNKVVKTVHVSEFDNQRFMGGWHTYCVNEQPN